MSNAVKKQLKFYFDYWKYVIAVFLVTWILEISLKPKEGLFIACCFSLGMLINMLLINQLKMFPFMIKLGCNRKDYFKGVNLFSAMLVAIFIILLNIGVFAEEQRIKDVSLYAEFEIFLLIITIVLFLNILITLLLHMEGIYWIALVLVILSIPITFRYKIYNYFYWTSHDGIQGHLETLLNMVLVGGLLIFNWILIKKAEISN